MLFGALTTSAAAVASWVGLRRDVRDSLKMGRENHEALGHVARRTGRLERFESSAVEKLDSVCSRLDETRDEVKTLAKELRAFMQRPSDGRHGRN